VGLLPLDTEGRIGKKSERVKARRWAKQRGKTQVWGGIQREKVKKSEIEGVSRFPHLVQKRLGSIGEKKKRKRNLGRTGEIK